MTIRLPSAAVTLAAAFCLVSSAPAQSADRSGPVTVVSHVDIKPDAYLPQAEENAARIFREQDVATRNDAGLVSFVILQEIGSKNHFTFVETWRDARAYALHEGAPHTVKFRNEIQPLLGGPIDIRPHRSFR